MTIEEHETTIVYDYATDTVTFFTTRRGERRNLVDRVGQENIISETVNDQSWKIKVDMQAFRKPYMASSVISNN